MASQADIDLVISTAGALPRLERDLNRIITTAQNDAEPVDVQAGLNAQRSLRRLDAQLNTLITQAGADADPVQVQALINQQRAVRDLQRQVTTVITAVNRSDVDPVTIQAVMNAPQTIATVGQDLRRVVASLQATDPEITIDVDVDEPAIRRLSNTLGRVTSGARTAGASVGRLGASVGALALGATAGAKALAAVVAAAQQLAPAAAIGTQAFLAQKVAAGTLKLALVGVSDAIEQVFDPDADPKELEKSLKRLAPEARKVVEGLRGMRAELVKVQQQVQNTVFKDFDEVLGRLGRSVLPLVRRTLLTTAGTFNEMGKSVAAAAQELATDGTLGKALDGASKGLNNLRNVPAAVTTAFGQLSAAAAPAFDKLTRRIDTAVAGLAERINKAFETGDLEAKINKAFSTLGQLLRSVGNILGGLQNIFQGLTADGRGLFDILESLSQAFEDLTASEEFQTILTELAKTADVLVQQVLPLLQEAFVQLAPVITILAPVVRDFLAAIGPELIPVLQELGPILVDIALIMKDQLPLAIELTKAALGALVIVLQGVRFVLEEIVLPASRKVAEFFNSPFAKAIRDISATIGSFSLNAIKSFNELANAVGRNMGTAATQVANFSSRLRGDFVTGISSALSQSLRRFDEFGSQIANAFNRLGPAMFGIGADIIRGLIGGLRSQLDRLVGVARGIANAISSTIRGALDINSPSRVTFADGEFAGMGLEKGLLSRLPSIRDAVSKMLQPIVGIDGLSMAPLAGAATAPAVNVFIGSERLTARIDYEVNTAFAERDRITTQGVRRFGS
ncbi:hypothetical protein ACIGBL_33300 [Streptomyces sp. NPDC085614]|uniref:hypothetical protein n=1 Tax=Streptomyces sp. NPDC085614 TaxID=3365733 RepID=UPI0037D7CDBD